MIQLYNYQTHIENELDKLHDKNCCVQLATGGGKTFTFAHYLLQQSFKTNTVRFMVLVHREELLEQTVESFRDLGIDPDVIHAPSTQLQLKTRNHGECPKNKRFIVAMVETLASRIKKGFTPHGVDTIVVDECHRGEFFKITGGWQYDRSTGQLEYIDGLLPHRRRIGFTATPVFMEKKKAMSLYYDELVLGADIDELIDFGSLVKPNTYIAPIDPASFQSLESANNTAGFTNVSLNGVFTTPEMISSVWNEYVQHGMGRQTIIFAVSVQHANQLHEHFTEKGANVRTYHSKGDNVESRREIVKWFKSEPDSVLINVDVFTTGFDCKTVGCVIMARSTRSLPLFLQIVGRGGRAYEDDEWTKTSWNFVDLGFNIQGVDGVFNGHGYWEDKRAKQWKKEFDNFTLETQEMPTKTCQECEHENRISARVCEECGTEFQTSVNVRELLERSKTELKNEVDKNREMMKIASFAIQKMQKMNHKPARAVHLMISKLFEITIERHQITPEQWDAHETQMRNRVWELFQQYFIKMCEMEPQTFNPKQISTPYWRDQLTEKLNVFWLERREKFLLLES